MSKEEPAWKAELGNMIGNLADLFPEAEGLRAIVSVLVNHQIKAAEQRGREVGLREAAAVVAPSDSTSCHCGSCRAFREKAEALRALADSQ